MLEKRCAILSLLFTEVIKWPTDSAGFIDFKTVDKITCKNVGTNALPL